MLPQFGRFATIEALAARAIAARAIGDHGSDEIFEPALARGKEKYFMKEKKLVGKGPKTLRQEKINVAVVMSAALYLTASAPYVGRLC